MCDNELHPDAILNMFFSKFASVMACKNILTNSSRHVRPLPLAYYSLNLLPSGGSKTKPYKIINGFYNWLNDIYREKNEINKINYIEEKTLGLNGREKDKKTRELEKEVDNLFCVNQNINGATSQRLYLLCSAIKYMSFGSLFFYDTEFLEKFEKLGQKNNYDNVLSLVYNLYDGDLDTVSTALTNREEITGISCSACFASTYSKLIREERLFKKFKEYLCAGLARRIFLYISKEDNGTRVQNELPSVDDIYIAKARIPKITDHLKGLYDSVKENCTYNFGKSADKYINEYHKYTKDKAVEEFSYIKTLPIEDEILRVELEGSTWKIVKLAFIFHLLKNPSSLLVERESVEKAVDFYNRTSEYLSDLLNKRALDEDDNILIFANKNLDKKIDVNNEFKKIFSNSIRHGWKKFKEGELQDMLDGLQSEKIFYFLEKTGKREYIKFYKQKQGEDKLVSL